MAELKKCPFCGSDAEVHQNQAGMFVVRCVKFGCWVSTMPCDFEGTAIIKWNTRPTTTEAEIRASAIDRFLAEMLNEFDSRYADIEEHTGSYVVSRLHAVAEQLKEE